MAKSHITVGHIFRLSLLAAPLVLASGQSAQTWAQPPNAAGDAATPAEEPVQSFAVRHRDAADLANQIRTMLPGDSAAGLFVSPRANEIVFRGDAAEGQLVAQLIAKMDQPAAQAVQNTQPAEQTPPTLEAYTIEPARLQQMQEWVAKLPSSRTQRAAWDQRTDNC